MTHQCKLLVIGETIGMSGRVFRNCFYVSVPSHLMALLIEPMASHMLGKFKFLFSFFSQANLKPF